jgi:hypothetical protein
MSERDYWRKACFFYIFQFFRWFWSALHLRLHDKTIMARNNGKEIQFVFDSNLLQVCNGYTSLHVPIYSPPMQVSLFLANHISDCSFRCWYSNSKILLLTYICPIVLCILVRKNFPSLNLSSYLGGSNVIPEGWWTLLLFLSSSVFYLF